MPELPDVEAYLYCLRERVVGERLEKVRLFNPFVLRSVSPQPREAEGKLVLGVRRMGKRIVFALEDEVFIVVHLMISGRFRWLAKGAKAPGKMGHAALDFEDGTLMLVEASSKKRASIHLVQGIGALAEHDRGGLEPLDADLASFSEALLSENRTLKRALTNPHKFSGIGNAYSDEILHAARLSPMRLTKSLTPEEVARLYEATQTTLTLWSAKLREQFKTKFPGPGEITAFRPDFAAHGKYGQPCPTCGKPIQRIVYAENETNYCAVCQNEGRLLADRSLSRLLKDDWPRTLEEMGGD